MEIGSAVSSQVQIQPKATAQPTKASSADSSAPESNSANAASTTPQTSSPQASAADQARSEVGIGNSLNVVA